MRIIKKSLLVITILLFVIFSFCCAQDTGNDSGSSGKLEGFVSVYINDIEVKKFKVFYDGSSDLRYPEITETLSKAYNTFVKTELDVKLVYSDSLNNSDIGFIDPNDSDYSFSSIDKKNSKLKRIANCGWRDSEEKSFYIGIGSIKESFKIKFYDIPYISGLYTGIVIEHGEKKQFTATLSGNTDVKVDSGEVFNQEDIIYSSSVSGIVDIVDGEFWAIGPGEAVVTAQLRGNSNVTESISISVKPRNVRIVNNALNLQKVGIPVLGFSVEPVTPPTISTISIPQKIVPFISSSAEVDPNCKVLGDTFAFKNSGNHDVKIKSDYNHSTSINTNFSVIENTANYSISGYSKSSAGGDVLADVIVTLYNEDGTVSGTTTTDVNGAYSFINLNYGYYTLLSKKNGYATSKHQHIPLVNSSYNIDLIQHPVVISSRSTVPPSVRIIDNSTSSEISKFNKFQTSQRIKIEGIGVNAIVGNSKREAIYLKINNHENKNSVATKQDSVLESILSLSGCAEGLNWMSATVFDNNNNNTTKYVLFTTGEESGTTYTYVPGVDYNVGITAVTYSENLNFYSSNGRTCKVEIKSSSIYSSRITGLRVHRSNTVDGNYVLVGDTFDKVSSSFMFEDLSGDLKPGSTYYYKLSYIINGGEGGLSSPIEVKVLPEYTLNLVSPLDHNMTNGNPTFNWTVSGIMPMGVQRTDVLIIEDQVTNKLVYLKSLIDSEAFNFNISNLPSGREFRWNIFTMCKATVINGNVTVNQISYPTSDSVAYLPNASNNMTPSIVNFSNNGWFNFLVQ